MKSLWLLGAKNCYTIFYSEGIKRTLPCIALFDLLIYRRQSDLLEYQLCISLIENKTLRFLGQKYWFTKDKGLLCKIK